MLSRVSFLLKAVIYGIPAGFVITIATYLILVGIIAFNSVSNIMSITAGSMFKTVQIIFLTGYISSVIYLYIIFSVAESKK